MQKKSRVAQFVPYFPPHTGGVEQYAADFALNFVKFDAGEMIIVTPDIGQNQEDYLIDWYRVITYPVLEPIHNFPVPKFWRSEFWRAIKELKSWQPTALITHTRFFMPSLVGGIITKIQKIKWVHVEHGSGWVDAGSVLVNFCSYLYDQIIGRWILAYSDEQVCVSRDVERFIQTKLWAKRTMVIYRWVELPKVTRRWKWDDKIIIGYIGRLIKWKNVESFVRATYQLDPDMREHCRFMVVWDGPEMEHLKLIDTDRIFEFTGNKPFQEALEIQASFDIHIHCSSPWGWLATTILQAMNFGCLIVATPFEWALDVLIDGKNAFLLNNESPESITLGIERAYANFKSKDIFAQENRYILEEKFTWENTIDEFVKIFKKHG